MHRFLVKAGSAFEESDKNGTAHLLEHMIFKGSNKIKPGNSIIKLNLLEGLVMLQLVMMMLTTMF